MGRPARIDTPDTGFEGATCHSASCVTPSAARVRRHGDRGHVWGRVESRPRTTISFLIRSGRASALRFGGSNAWRSTRLLQLVARIAVWTHRRQGSDQVHQ